MTPTELSAATGISVPYASQILTGKRKPPLPVAINIYDKTGRQFGGLVGLSKVEIEAARKIAA